MAFNGLGTAKIVTWHIRNVSPLFYWLLFAETLFGNWFSPLKLYVLLHSEHMQEINPGHAFDRDADYYWPNNTWLHDYTEGRFSQWIAAPDNYVIVKELAQWDILFSSTTTHPIWPSYSKCCVRFLFRRKKSNTAAHPNHHVDSADEWYLKHFYTWPIRGRLHAELPWESFAYPKTTAPHNKNK